MLRETADHILNDNIRSSRGRVDGSPTVTIGAKGDLITATAGETTAMPPVLMWRNSGRDNLWNEF